MGHVLHRSPKTTHADRGGSSAIAYFGRDRHRRRQRAGRIDDRPSSFEARLLVPVEIVDQWIAPRRAPARCRRPLGERSIRAGDGRIDRGEGSGKTRIGSVIGLERRIVVEPALAAVGFRGPGAVCLPSVDALSPAAQLGEARRGQRSTGLGLGDAPAGAHDRMGAGELVSRGADVHARVVENEILQMDELAVDPQTGSGVGVVGARDPAVAD